MTPQVCFKHRRNRQQTYYASNLRISLAIAIILFLMLSELLYYQDYAMNNEIIIVGKRLL